MPPALEPDSGVRIGPPALLLSGADFARLARFIEGTCGIRMPPSKKTLLESRLRSRVFALGLKGFSAYCTHVLGATGGDERARMVDLVTTNQTAFFRERQHFDVLTGSVLPDLAARCGAGVIRPLRIWSAGCATGEEPYTLIMVLLEALVHGRTPSFELLGTDLSRRVLQHAAEGVYRDTYVQSIPLELRRKYLLRNIADPALVRVCGRLRRAVSLRALNLLEEDYGLGQPMDVIFCRNVFIYFDRATQRAILHRFAENTIAGGYLFLGHSETIHGLDVPFAQVAPTVYCRS